MEKELKRLSRSELVEIIYQYQQREQELLNENEKLKAQLEDKQIKISKVGSIAQASLALNEVFEAAQAAADQYLENVQQRGKEYLEMVQKVQSNRNGQD